jgi:hypothetical protein
MWADSTPRLPQPLWFLVFFAVLWLLVTGALAHLGGWASLARSYRAAGPISGDSFRFASGSVGRRHFPVHYRGCLFVTLGAEGLYMSIFMPFRFQSPALRFPWSQIAGVTERRALFNTYYLIAIRGHWARISLWGRSGRKAYEMFGAITAAASLRAPGDYGSHGISAGGAPQER